jgi:hypothetical protein
MGIGICTLYGYGTVVYSIWTEDGLFASYKEVYGIRTLLLWKWKFQPLPLIFWKTHVLLISILLIHVQRLHNEKVITQVVSSSLKMMNSLAHIQHSGGQLEFFLRVNWYEESDIRELMNMQKGRRNKKERKFQISKLMTLQVCAAL